jgi:3-phenylpropionate/trans-cinnamate dioxygenase ferredoxin reductase component
MTENGVIVVGSGPAGVAAAESFREHNSDAPVQIFTADIDLPYARPPLSKEYLRGQTDDVALHDAQWFEIRAIELVRGAAVDRLDLSDRAVYVGDQRHAFDILILACGSAPLTPPVPGGQRAQLLRSLADAAALREAAHTASSAVVIGSGFIGCEAAASLALRGMPVTLVAPNHFRKKSGSAARPRNACVIW